MVHMVNNMEHDYNDLDLARHLLGLLLKKVAANIQQGG